MAHPPHLTLIDGSGFIFRAYHRLPPLTNPEGTPVGALFGFTSMLWNQIEAARKSPEDDYFAVVLDAGRRSFRNDLYPDYKANRPPPPEDLAPQFPLIRDAVGALGVPCIEEPGLEADDLIASYAEAALAAGMQVTIISSDKDLMQLVRPGLSLLDTMQNRRFHEADVQEKWGVPPARLGEVLALMGDSVDNVPGVPGVGPKTAAELVNQYGTVEDVLAATGEIRRPKLRENLETHADAARLSRILVELKRDIPLDPPLPALRLDHQLDVDRLTAFLAQHGFRTLLAKLGASGQAAAQTIARPQAPDAPPAMAFEHDGYETVTTAERLGWWLDAAEQAGVVAFDTETNSLDAIQAELVGFSLAIAPNKACYVPLGHCSGEGLLQQPVVQLPLAQALAGLRSLLENPAVLKVGQNLKYDMQVMARHGIGIGPFDDTMLLSYALAGGMHGHGMDDLSERHLGHTPISYASVTGTGKAAIGFAQVPVDQATRYAAEDADVTLRLWQRLRPDLWRSRVTRAYEWCDRPLVPVLARMERAGVLVDRVELSRMSAEFATAMASLEARAHRIAGRPFTLGSPRQLGDILFTEMGATGGKKGRSGQYSTDVTELERLAEAQPGSPVAELATTLLDWRQVAKLRSTYTEALQQQINPETGRVHTSFAMAATSTGRLASSDPNLQNIPIRTDMGRRIRDAFVAPPGHVLLSADYNQIELRLMAHMADVPELKAAYTTGEDIHWLTARQIFGLPAETPVDRDLRARAKTINFSIIYGISAFGLAQRLAIPRAEAADFIERYLDHYSGIRRYMAETVAKVRADGFVTTLFGRRVHVPMIRSKVQSERAGAERAAINAPVQGTAADLIKRAMVRMEPALAEAGLTGTRMLLQVHDELVFEVPDHEIETATRVIRTIMESAAAPALRLSIPLGVEVGTGPNWGAAH